MKDVTMTKMTKEQLLEKISKYVDESPYKKDTGSWPSDIPHEDVYELDNLIEGLIQLRFGVDYNEVAPVQFVTLNRTKFYSAMVDVGHLPRVYQDCDKETLVGSIRTALAYIDIGKEHIRKVSNRLENWIK